MKSKILQLILFFFLSVIFVACTVGPDFTPPKLYENEQIEKALELKPKKENTEKSYLIFNDNILNKLIAMAVENSPSVRSAISSVKQARMAVQIADVQGLPTLDGLAQYNYVKESRNIGYVLNQDVYQTGLDASWELDIFGGSRRRSEAQLALAYMTIANLENVYISLTSEVTLAYISLRGGQSLEKLMLKQLELQNKVLEYNNNLWKSGLVSYDVLNNSKIDIENTKSEIASTQTQMKQSENQLALLTGQLPNQMQDLLKTEKYNFIDEKIPFDTENFYNISADVLENRSDVKAALYELKAQNAQIGVAVSELYPKISLSAMLGFQSLHLDKLLKNKSYSYSFTPVLSVPLFYFGQLKKQVQLEEEKYNQLFSLYENTFLTAAQEIKDAFIALQNAEKQYDAAEKKLFEMRKVYDLTLNKKHAGLINNIDIDQVHIQLLSIQKNYLSTKISFYASVVRLFKAMGVVS